MEGENTQFNGDGFAEQKFLTNVVSAEDFEAWVEEGKAKQRPARPSILQDACPPNKAE